MNAEERVIEGAKYLDAKMPGWHNKIDMDELDLVSPCNCVLGQLVGPDYTYYSVVNSMGYDPSGNNLAMSHQEALDLGFDAGEGFRLKDWNELTESWKVMVEKRRAEDGTLL